MLLPRHHWLQQHVAAQINWLDVWNSPPTEPDPVVAVLDARLPWRPTDPIMFVWMRERAVSAPWATFRRTWRAYLFDDEGPVLLSPQLPQAVSFSPTGAMLFSSRAVPPAD